MTAAILWLTALLVSGLKIEGFWAALIGVLLYWPLNIVINKLFEQRKERAVA